jgi:lipoprotein NlpI
MGHPAAARDSYQKALDTRLKLALAVPHDRADRADVGSALFELASTGVDVEPLLQHIRDDVSVLVAAKKFLEVDAVFLGGITDQLAYRYLGDAGDKFYAGHPDQAIAEAQKAAAAAPSHAYPPLILHLFRLRSGENDSAEFAKDNLPTDHSEWPWPVVQFLRGETDAAAFMLAASTGDESDRHGQVCEADFFVGVTDVVQNKPDDARPLLQSAVNQCPHNYTVYGPAVAELKRLDTAAVPQAKH